MTSYDDLEFQVLSCFLQEPGLMKGTMLQDKHFVRHKRLWVFMKTFYEKFGNFDFSLMYEIVDRKEVFIEYMTRLLDFELLPSHFKQYEKQLIDSYEESKKNKWIIKEIYELANRLYVRMISTDDFKARVEEIYKNADRIYEREEK